MPWVPVASTSAPVLHLPMPLDDHLDVAERRHQGKEVVAGDEVKDWDLLLLAHACVSVCVLKRRHQGKEVVAGDEVKEWGLLLLAHACVSVCVLLEKVTFLLEMDWEGKEGGRVKLAQRPQQGA